MLYDESVLKSVKKDFENRKLVQSSVNESAKSNDELIAQLKDDLQHERETVANLTRLLDQSQQLQLSLQQQIKALKAPQKTPPEATTGTENAPKAEAKETTDDTKNATEQPDKRHWWQRMFTD